MTRLSCVILLLVFFGGISWAQMGVTDGQTAATLAATLAGKGVTILNPTLNCRDWASGTFSVTVADLGLDSGIVLTTGRAASKPGAYGVNGPSANFASLNNGAAGDAALSSLARQPTYDACALEFDIIPHGDTIRFSYVFSSEEYQSAVCGSYNDVFAFFISGPGITGQENMAIIPGTDIPVAINSVNDGTPGSAGNLRNCTSMGPGSPYTSYYRDNVNGKYLSHYGLTSVLQASHAVTRCSRYHLKIVIADAGNEIYDSGVFLKAGSLESESYSVAAIRQIPNDTMAFCVKGCAPGRFTIRRSSPGSRPQTIKFLVGGNAVSGYDYGAIPDSVVIPANAISTDLYINGLPTPVLGSRTIKLFLLDPSTCSGLSTVTDSASMIIYDTLHIELLNPENTVCAGDTVQFRVLGDSFLSYHWSPPTQLNNAAIPDPIAIAAQDMVYHLTVSLPGTLCAAKTADATITTRLTPKVTLTRELAVCYNTQLQFTPVTADSNAFYSYKWIGPNGFTSTLKDPVISHLQLTDRGSYTITVSNDTNGCKSIGRTYLQVNTPPMPETEGIVRCLNDAVTDLVIQGDSIRWYASEDDTNAILKPDYSTAAVATYLFFTTQTIKGCESPRAKVEVDVRKCCDGQISFPTAFTPNGDGLNDKFRPVLSYGYFITDVQIINRWGQVVYSGLDGTWDGMFGGVAADVGVYFYRMTFGCIKGGAEKRQGDVTLIR